ncbi:EAL domain-containing protein [Vibrio sp. SCSIO 43135]|uniref:EAL domain-containing protein n=1 Tax=Vibrio sp. SCSIO 43135 TaxID=2819096 RepID=UPI002074F117|nr:EAL domain-containing protein [Vibrio sp. SCSIO 43135]USD43843.1 EAL domain-containing protein [Vibrio sp. SCSIO 43135]
MNISDQLIKDAFAKGWHTCFYQPLVEPSLDTVKGVEVLFRLKTPSHGIVSPASFIERAFELGFEQDIFQIVLSTALTEVTSLSYPCPVAINVSYNVLDNEKTYESVRALLWDHSYPAHMLTFELSESDDVTECSQALIDKYKALGIKISIDDFGAGYSNINKLLALNVDEVKFDKNLINTNHQNGYALLKSILLFCKEMGIATVAEGVENADTRIYVRNLGFDQYQGFHFSKPVCFQELKTLVAA